MQCIFFEIVCCKRLFESFDNVIGNCLPDKRNIYLLIFCIGTALNELCVFKNELVIEVILYVSFHYGVVNRISSYEEARYYNDYSDNSYYTVDAFLMLHAQALMNGNAHNDCYDCG